MIIADDQIDGKVSSIHILLYIDNKIAFDSPLNCIQIDKGILSGLGALLKKKNFKLDCNSVIINC